MDTPDPAAAVQLPTPPFVDVQGIPNFRDLGGYATNSDGTHSVRTDLIYRCGEPSRVTEQGIKTLQSLRITHIYDLRSNTEIQRNLAAGRGGVVEWEGCERVFVPVFQDQDYSPEGIASRYKDYSSGGPEVTNSKPESQSPGNQRGDEQWLRNFATQGFTRAYSDILANAPPSYRRILLHLANEPQKRLIVHCTAGKDRTGVLCALVLSLCGVGDEAVSQEYSLTELGLAEHKDKIIQHLMTNPALKDNQEGALNMISARAENMMATLAMIRETFGGPEGYMVEKCGLTKVEVQRIKDNLIIERAPVHA